MNSDELKRRTKHFALRESEQWLSTTLRNIGDAVIATDAKGLVTLMNPVAEDLTGWDEAEAVGKPLEDVFNIINEQTGEPAENPAARVLREGLVVGMANHTVLIAKDGAKRPIADSGVPMRDAEGNIIGTVMIFRNITERKQAEEKEHHRNIELLSETAMQFVELPSNEDIYGFIGKQLKKFTEKNSYIVINSVDEEKNILTTRAAIGMGKLADKVIKLIGKDPVGMTYNAKDVKLAHLYNGKLHLYKEGLFGILLNTIPKHVSLIHHQKNLVDLDKSR